MCWTNPVSILGVNASKKHGKVDIFLDWGHTYGDYNCLAAGLESVGRGDLLPRKPEWPERPLAWWQGIRKQVGANASSFSCKLGRIYKFLFPENHRLFQSWHTAGADVQMTIHVIEAYFDRVMGKAPRGTIDSFFLSPVPGGREPPPASLELSTPESNQSGDQILEIGDDEWMSVVDEQDIIHELEELEAEVNTEDETDYSDLESIWSVEPDSEIDEIEIEE